MKSEDIARYLQENPAFFELHAELLSQIHVPHPHGGRAIPLVERQVVALRDKNRVLETKLGELIRFGEENDALGEKVHRLALALIAARDLDALLAVLDLNLREDFSVPHVAVRLWRGNPPVIEGEPVSAEMIDYAAQLDQPYCGPAANPEAVRWFGEAAPHVRSCACVRLADESGVFGMLVLGAEDPQRFYPEMGVLYLRRIGELAAATIARLL